MSWNIEWSDFWRSKRQEFRKLTRNTTTFLCLEVLAASTEFFLGAKIIWNPYMSNLFINFKSNCQTEWMHAQLCMRIYVYTSRKPGLEKATLAQHDLWTDKAPSQSRPSPWWLTPSELELFSMISRDDSYPNFWSMVAELREVAGIKLWREKILEERLACYPGLV